MVQAASVSDGPIRRTPSVVDVAVEPGTPDPPSDPHPPKVARSTLEKRAMM